MASSGDLNDLVENTYSETKSHFLAKTIILIRILYVIGFLCLLINIILFYIYTKKKTNVVIFEANNHDQSINKEILIDISGAVVHPGIYKLTKGSRINGRVLAAGGILEEANKEWVQKNLNLAQEVKDGEKLYIPFESEGGEILSSSSIKNEVDTNKINLNTVSLGRVRYVA